MLKSLRVAIGILSLMMLLTGGFGCSRPSATTTTSNTQATIAVTTPPVSTSHPPTTTIPVTTTSTPPTTSMTTMPTTTPPPTTTTKPPPTTSTPPTTTGVATSTVIVSGYTFSPDTIQVPVGTRVVWKNLDAADHTVTSVSPGFFDNPLPSLGTTSITFTVPGRYDYICSIHPYMTGTVIVK